jgi:hypothetical protein
MKFQVSAIINNYIFLYLSASCELLVLLFSARQLIYYASRDLDMRIDRFLRVYASSLPSESPSPVLAAVSISGLSSYGSGLLVEYVIFFADCRCELQVFEGLDLRIEGADLFAKLISSR